MERDSTPWSEVFVPTPARSLVDPVEMGRDESPWTDLFQGSQEEASAAAPTAPDAAKPGADRHPTQ
jgi:hypothetical protein